MSANIPPRARFPTLSFRTVCTHRARTHLDTRSSRISNNYIRPPSYRGRAMAVIALRYSAPIGSDKKRGTVVDR